MLIIVALLTSEDHVCGLEDETKDLEISRSENESHGSGKGDSGGSLVFPLHFVRF